MKIFAISIIFIFLSIPIHAERLFGKIQSAEGEPLPGATIFIHELEKGTITDLSGFYEFENLKSGTYHLHVTFVGYRAEDKTIKLDQNREVNFSLEATTIELNEILVESDPFKSGPLEQSLTIETVEKDFLERNNKGTFVNSLQTLPGINAINTGVGIAKPVIRGMSFNRVIVNDQGIKQEGQQWGADHGLEIDQYAPERVEIIKGPSSLLYGSDGIGGVINIRQPALPKEGNISGSVFTTYKSNNHLYGTSSMLQGNLNGKVFRARFSTQDFGDYQVPADQFNYLSYIYDIHDNSLKNTAGRERNGSAMFGWTGDWGHSTVTVSNFNQRAGMFPGAIGRPGEYDLSHDGDFRNIGLPRQVINHLKVTSNSNIQIGNDWLEMDIGYQQNIRREESFPHAHGKAPMPEGNLALKLNLQTVSANLRYHHNVSESYSSIYGIQFQNQRNIKGGFEHLLPNFTNNTLGTYTYHEYTFLDRLSVNGGLRIDYGISNIDRFAEPDYYTEDSNGIIVRNVGFEKEFVNLSGAAGVSFHPNNTINLKANLGSSFRMPTPAELAINGVHHGTFRHEVGDSTLRSERGYQADLNFSFKKRNIFLTVTPFFNYFTNYIYLGPSGRFTVEDIQGKIYTLPESGQVYQYFQNDAVFAGGELSFEYHLIDELHWRAALEYVYNYNLDKHLPLPFTPPMSVLSEIKYEKKVSGKSISNYYLGIDVQRFAAQNRVDRNEKRTPGYTLFNFSSGMTINMLNAPIDLNLGVSNIFNTRYLNHLSRYRLLNLPEQGRNIILSLKVPFGL